MRALWDLCAARNVVPGLLVVPDWHGVAPVERDAAFCEWLRECAEQGAEILLHGERHDEVGSPRAWRDALRALGRTDGEGEFLTLGYTAARDRVDRGLERLRTIGLEPLGFVPPAWLCRAETHEAVRDAGLAVSEDFGAIYVHARNAVVRSPVVVWSARGAWRAWGSVVVARARWLTQRGADVVRIALHPADLGRPATARSVAHALDRWLAARPHGSYRALCPPGAGSVTIGTSAHPRSSP